MVDPAKGAMPEDVARASEMAYEMAMHGLREVLAGYAGLFAAAVLSGDFDTAEAWAARAFGAVAPFEELVPRKEAT